MKRHRAGIEHFLDPAVKGQRGDPRFLQPFAECNRGCGIVKIQDPGLDRDRDTGMFHDRFHRTQGAFRIVMDKGNALAFLCDFRRRAAQIEIENIEIHAIDDLHRLRQLGQIGAHKLDAEEVFIRPTDRQHGSLAGLIDQGACIDHLGKGITAAVTARGMAHGQVRVSGNGRLDHGIFGINAGKAFHHASYLEKIRLALEPPKPKLLLNPWRIVTPSRSSVTISAHS